MCWYCCTSLRGAVYFGTSVHIFAGLVLLLKLVAKCYVSIFITENLILDPSVLISYILSTVYVTLFLFFGCLIFRGTEKKSLSLLKWSAAGFTILQLLYFTVHLILFLVLPSPSPEANSKDEFILSVEIGLYIFSFVASINYIIVLILYLRKLWRRKNGNHHQSQNNTTLSTTPNTRTLSSNNHSECRPNHQHHHTEPLYSTSPTYRSGSSFSSVAYYRNNQPTPGPYDHEDSQAQLAPFLPSPIYGQTQGQGNHHNQQSRIHSHYPALFRHQSTYSDQEQSAGDELWEQPRIQILHQTPGQQTSNRNSQNSAIYGTNHMYETVARNPETYLESHHSSQHQSQNKT